MDEYLNGYKLMIRLRKDLFIILHILPRLIWIIVMIYIVYVFRLICLTSLSIETCLYILVCGISLYISLKGEKHLFKLIEKKVKAKYGEFKEVTCTVDDNRFLCEQGNNINEILFSQIYKVVEDNKSIYIFGEEYIILLVIPTSVFKNVTEKDDFLIKMEGLIT
ncbi:YcxB family protein [Paraclostridium bifermentans]|uniref:YcxB family protein n=1 Tax=Paraclostridium bifermentans TaxID=1490 RepID=UPI000587C515|nr:YcxB family protein [Paraclostridium bifermentans]